MIFLTKTKKRVYPCAKNGYERKREVKLWDIAGENDLGMWPGLLFSSLHTRA
ncbi:hypothetical protein B4096_1476 [Heyndrickxia coagulans]|nr:hypothetical protein B4096_1476 [Heyndrickxia coagulans]